MIPHHVRIIQQCDGAQVMNDQEITAKFSAQTIRNADVSTWHAPENEGARKAFVRAMRGKQYGYNALLDAWVWFLHGWESNEP